MTKDLALLVGPEQAVPDDRGVPRDPLRQPRRRAWPRSRGRVHEGSDAAASGPSRVPSPRTRLRAAGWRHGPPPPELARRYWVVTLTLGDRAGSASCSRSSGAGAAVPWIFSGYALAIAAWQAVGMVRDILRGHWGLDILAVTAIVATVARGRVRRRAARGAHAHGRRGARGLREPAREARARRPAHPGAAARAPHGRRRDRRDARPTRCGRATCCSCARARSCRSTRRCARPRRRSTSRRSPARACPSRSARATPC